jgi:hypothetical protein
VWGRYRRRGPRVGRMRSGWQEAGGHEGRTSMECWCHALVAGAGIMEAQPQPPAVRLCAAPAVSMCICIYLEYTLSLCHSRGHLSLLLISCHTLGVLGAGAGGDAAWGVQQWGPCVYTARTGGLVTGDVLLGTGVSWGAGRRRNSKGWGSLGQEGSSKGIKDYDMLCRSPCCQHLSPYPHRLPLVLHAPLAQGTKKSGVSPKRKAKLLAKARKAAEAQAK